MSIFAYQTLAATPAAAVPEVRRPGVEIVKFNLLDNPEENQVRALVVLENFGPDTSHVDLVIRLEGDPSSDPRVIRLHRTLDPREQFTFRSEPFSRQPDETVQAHVHMDEMVLVER
ncbi:MAG: hypothetical protein KC910_13530 [Candidatus Eremiobacteraeota bacterium]|nr:hypothetical protein [Candidatus Eremiobacteraeota bacterium]